MNTFVNKKILITGGLGFIDANLAHRLVDAGACVTLVDSLIPEYGGQLFPEQHFYADESCLERTYDFVMASTSLHYSQDWQTLLQQLAGATRNYLYIANLPTVKRVSSFVFLQRPYHYGYNTEYLAWCLNRTEFLRTAECAGLTLAREFIYGHEPLIRGAPEQNMYRGYLFQTHPKERA
jgi:hypothetical protein